MSRWTEWRKIAEGNNWHDDTFDYEGAACYELAIGGPRGGNIQPVYVGETNNEKKRISDYARHGSHISDKIDAALKQRFSLYYRAQVKASKKEAKQMQDNLLSRHKYAWNTQLNGN